MCHIFIIYTKKQVILLIQLMYKCLHGLQTMVLNKNHLSNMGLSTHFSILFNLYFLIIKNMYMKMLSHNAVHTNLILYIRHKN